jgi:hypothetical protein
MMADVAFGLSVLALLWSAWFVYDEFLRGDR